MGGAAADGTLGTISGVVVPTCENMWGVLIFLRFFFVVGHAGVWQALVIVFISFLSSFFTTMSLAGREGWHSALPGVSGWLHQPPRRSCTLPPPCHTYPPHRTTSRRRFAKPRLRPLS
jgi:hypothetical protein